MIRFLFVNLPFSSHVNPTPDLVRELTQAGHHVTYVLANELHEQLEGTGAALVPYDNYDSDWSEARRYMVSFERAYETAKRVGKEKDFDCLVHEAVFVFGNQLAEDLNLTRVRFFSTFAFNHEVLDRILETGGVHFNLFENGNPIYKMMNGYFDHVKGMMQSSDVMNEIADHVPDLNITYTSREFQYLSEQFDEKRFYFVGPPINEDAVETADFNWEQMTRPIIYIAILKTNRWLYHLAYFRWYMPTKMLYFGIISSFIIVILAIVQIIIHTSCFINAVFKQFIFNSTRITSCIIL